MSLLCVAMCCGVMVFVVLCVGRGVRSVFNVCVWLFVIDCCCCC